MKNRFIDKISEAKLSNSNHIRRKDKLETFGNLITREANIL